MKKIKYQEQQFACMVSTLTHQSKPTKKEASSLKLAKFNQKRVLTISQLKTLIEKGHSFHASVLDYRLRENANLDTAGLSGACFVPEETTLFSVDIDHGNYDLDRLKRTSTVPHALIYQTHSFTPNKKKWRVLFIANRPIKDKKEFDLVQQGLMFEFAKPFNPITLEDKVDFSAKDPARLSFGGKEVVDIQDCQFDIDQFITYLEKEDVYNQIETFRTIWNRHHQSEHSKETKPTSSKRRKERGEKDGINQTISLDELLTRISGYLPHDLPTNLPIERFLKELNKVPLHEVLGVEEKEMFCCLLPNHHDRTPSALVLKNKKGQSRYFCHGCGDGKSLSILDFIFQSQDLDSTDDLIQDTAPIAGRLGYILTENPLIAVKRNQILVSEKTTERSEIGEKVVKRLVGRRMVRTYETLLELAEQNLAKRVYTKAGNYCFYASNQYIGECCRKKGIQGHTQQNATGKKLNQLVHFHLLEKVTFDELTSEFQHHLLATYYQDKEKIKKMITIYQVPTLDDYRLKLVEDQFIYDRKNKIRSAGFSSKQLAQGVSEDHAREVFPTVDGTVLSKLDKRVIKMVDKAIPKLLEKYSFFTEEMLVKEMDRKGRLKKSEKAPRVKTFMGRFVKEHQLKEVKPNKVNRKTYNVPDKISSNKSIYVKIA